MRGIKSIFIWIVLGGFVLSSAGCDSFVRKFVRKPKTKEAPQDVQVLVPEEYTQAAILQQILDKLPALASAIAEPLAKTEKIVIINSGGDSNGGVGVSKLTRDIANTISQVPEVVEALTGISLRDVLGKLPAVRAADTNH